MDFKFLHAADIHLDSPLLGLERYEGAPVEQVRGATRKAFQNMVDLALEEGVDFVLISGDLYDGDWRDYNTGLFFTTQGARLREAGIKVFIVRGNHDAASQITRILRLPDNIKDLSTREPETVRLDDLGVALHGQGFPTPAVTEDLSRSYPEPLKGYFNIGLLHTCATGREGHASYAPCDLNYLINKGYDYWALGHVHKREVLQEDPWIIFPGNTQGRHIREEGAKGCTLVRVQGGRVQSLEHRDLDVLRWILCNIDVTEAETYEQVLEGAEKSIEEELGRGEGRLLALRLVIRGASNAHHKIIDRQQQLANDLRALAVERGLDRIWIEKIKVDTRAPVKREELLESTPVASLLEYIRESSRSDQLLEELIWELERERNALPAELFQEGEIDLADKEYLRSLLPQVEELIISRLMKGGEFTSED